MATTYKVLGQVKPATANTATTLYSGSSPAVVSTITICNQGTSAATYRISVRPAGATLEAKHYVAYDVSINAKTTTAFTIGITLAATDVITVESSNTNLSYNAFGSEVA
jgi:hypothetical protein